MKIAILGAGGMGCTVIGQAKQSPLADAIVAYDIDEARVRHAVKAFGVAGTTRLEEVLADPAVKLVFVTAANHAHKELAIRSMEAGKAVLCEKPMAVTLEDAAEMVRTGERLGAFFQVGFELRYIIVGTEGAAETDVFYRRIKRWRFTDTPQRLQSDWVEDLTWTIPEDHFYYHNKERTNA